MCINLCSIVRLSIGCDKKAPSPREAPFTRDGTERKKAAWQFGCRPSLDSVGREYYCGYLARPLAAYFVEWTPGGLVTFAAERVGTNLTVDVSGAVAFGSTGNLFAIHQGLMAAVKSEEAETLTIVAIKVGNEGLQSTLSRVGFESLGGTTFQGQSVQSVCENVQREIKFDVNQEK